MHPVINSKINEIKTQKNIIVEKEKKDNKEEEKEIKQDIESISTNKFTASAKSFAASCESKLKKLELGTNNHINKK